MVAIEGLAFKPATLTVPVGAIVRGVNRDSVVHPSTSDAAAWDSGNISPGGAWSRKFDKAGSFPYHCTPHPFMKGTIVVK